MIIIAALFLFDYLWIDVTAKLERLSVRVYNTSSVIVTWATPQVPLGVRVQAYTVHYRPLGSSEDHLSSGYVTTWESSAIVNGLRSHSSYHFWVQAVVVEGTVQSDNVISSEQVTVFLPGIYRLCDSPTVE